MALKPDKTSPLQMTPGEICGMFREAKNKIKQIAILAQVNATSKGRIIDILVDNGAELTPAVIDQFAWAETKEKYYAAQIEEQVRREAPRTPDPEPQLAADYEQQPEPRQLPEAEEEKIPEWEPMTDEHPFIPDQWLSDESARVMAARKYISAGMLRSILDDLPEEAPIYLAGPPGKLCRAHFEIVYTPGGISVRLQLGGSDDNADSTK